MAEALFLFSNENALLTGSKANTLLVATSYAASAFEPILEIASKENAELSSEL